MEELGRPRPGDGVNRTSDRVIVARYVLQGGRSLAAAADAMAVEESTGTTRCSDAVRARVGGEILEVEVAGVEPVALPSAPLARLGITSGEVGRVHIAWPAENAVSLPALLGLVAGETFETGLFGTCRLVGVELPDTTLSMFRGPRHGVAGVRAATGVEGRPLVGAIVKPSTGLRPDEFASVAAALARGGADFVKDDEILTDPRHCPFAARIVMTVAALEAARNGGRRALYAPNVTGSLPGLDRRIRLGKESGCGMLMINALTMGLEVLRTVAERTEVPVFAHRVLSGALIRSPAVGISPGVLAGLTRLAGADLVQVGGICGKTFEDDDLVVDSADNCGRPLGRIGPALPVSGGGQSEATVAQNAVAFGHFDFSHLLGSAATDDPDGPEAGVAKAIASWGEVLR